MGSVLQRAATVLQTGAGITKVRQALLQVGQLCVITSGARDITKWSRY